MDIIGICPQYPPQIFYKNSKITINFIKKKKFEMVLKIFVKMFLRVKSLGLLLETQLNQASLDMRPCEVAKGIVAMILYLISMVLLFLLK